MSYAVFFETQATEYGRPQFLVFPAKPNEAVVFTRVTNGGKKGLNRWRVTQALPSDQYLTREPTTLIVSEKDVKQYEVTGMVATLTTKALAAHAKAPAADTAVFDSTPLAARVALGDVTLAKWLRDGRRVKPVIFATIPQPTQSGVVSVAGSVNPVAPEPVVATVVEAAAIPVEVITITEPVVAVTVDVPVSVSVTPAATAVVRMAMVPDMRVATSYIHRKVSGQTDFAMLDFARANDMNVLLYGPTGSAKTTVAMAYAAQNNLPVFMVSGTVALEPSALFGAWVPDGEGGFVWQDGGVTELARHGGLLILDEVNFIPSKIATVLFALLAGTTRSLTLLQHKGETIKAHPDLFVVATMNPSYAGTQEMNQAFRNRYSIQRHWGYDDKVEKTLVPVKSLRDLAKQLREAENKEELLTPTPTNALMDFIKISKGLGLDFAMDTFLSRYAEDEQSKVKLVLDVHRLNIQSDLAHVSATVAEEDEEAPAPEVDALKELAGMSIDF